MVMTQFFHLFECVSYHEWQCYNEPNLEIRALNTSFNLQTKENGLAFFEYFNHTMKNRAKKKLAVDIPEKNFRGVVWEANTDEGGYCIVYDTYNKLKEYLPVDLTDLELTRFLLSVCEVDGSGDSSCVTTELNILSGNMLNF